MDKALSQVIDYQLEERTPLELACAYRALCASILVRTAMAHASKPLRRKDEIDNRRVAQNWVKSGDGIISFRQVCEALDADPDTIEEGIRVHAERGDDHAIRKSRKPRCHYVFGRNNPNANRGKHSAAH